LGFQSLSKKVISKQTEREDVNSQNVTSEILVSAGQFGEEVGIVLNTGQNVPNDWRKDGNDGDNVEISIAKVNVLGELFHFFNFQKFFVQSKLPR